MSLHVACDTDVYFACFYFMVILITLMDKLLQCHFMTVLLQLLLIAWLRILVYITLSIELSLLQCILLLPVRL